MSSYTKTTRTVYYSYGGTGDDGAMTTHQTVFSNSGPGINLNSNFGSLSIGGGGRYTATISKPLNLRYSRGWGSRKDRSAKGSLAPMKLKGKTYEEIKQQCLAEGKLFEDPDFPATDSSIFYSQVPPRPFVWKRPPEICSDAQFFSGGASRFDVKQGELGDCWLLAAIAGLCQHRDLFYRVVPPDQSFTKDYAGIFHFQFWQYGEWKDVIVDDRLPTYYDKLIYMHSVDKNEFWSPLLEKAYAKLCGSYEALKGGATCEAMEDFTGGVTEMIDLRKAPKNLFQIMLKAHDRNSLMGCSIDANPNQLEAELPNGLIMGHAYTITNVALIDIKTSRMKGKIPMVRVRNPWGNECEWKGAWSDKSQEWKFIPEEERKEIGLTFDDDGEFWMSFTDFCKNFQKLEICNLGPDSLSEDDVANKKKRWEATVYEGSWRRRVNAGGCRNYLDTFWTNPQYRVHVIDADEDDDENMGTLLVGLMQKGRRKLRKEGVDLLTIGYAIYKIDDGSDKPLDMRFFKYHASIAKSPAFINMREVCGRHKLEPGHYCIIPSTFEPNQEGDYLLRVYSEKPAALAELDEETGMADVQPIVEEIEEGGKKKRYMSFKFFNDLPFSHGIRGGRLHLPDLRRQFFSGIFKAKEPEVVEEGMTPVKEEVVTAIRYNYITGERAFVPGMTPDVEEPSYFTSQGIEVTQLDSQQEKELKESFRRVAGEDMEIDAYELQEILNAAFMKGADGEFRFDGFSSDTCRSMVAMMDDDRSGKLGYEEFKKLWTDLRLWKSVFKQFDKDKSGNFNSYELRMAFHSVGFRISNGTFNALVQRYSHRDSKIYFDDFIHCVVRMKTMFEIFKEMEEGGKAVFGLDQFIQTTMYS